MPRRIRFLFGPLIDDYNVLIRNVGSLFHEMEQSQLSIIRDRNRNDAILRSLSGALLTVDGEFRVTLSNKQAEQLFDVHAEGLLGKNLFELLPLNESGRELLASAFLYEQQISNKEIVLSDRKAVRHCTLNITFFKESQNSTEYCAAVMLQDIYTEYKRLQELIHQSEKFLAIGRLAGGVAHELNTPLGTIVGYRHTKGGVSNEDKRLEYGQAIYEEAKRCSSIIENLRTFARRDTCQPESCEVSGVIRDVVETIHNCPGKRHNVKIETHLASDALVRGAEGQLDIVLVNLIMNAVQSAAEVTSDPLVTVDCSARDDSVLISITDNGCGIPQARRNQVFDPFFSTKPDGSGIGLGLAISQSIVAGIGGTLTCNADYEGGARFIMTLPLAFGGGRNDDGIGRGRNRRGAAGTRPVILVVEDDEPMRKLIGNAEEKLDAKVLLAKNAHHAMEIIESQEIGVVLTDLCMPHADGMEILDFAKLRNLMTQVVLITGHATIESAIDALKGGAYDYLRKPFEPADLRREVENALRFFMLNRENLQLRENNEFRRADDLIGKSQTINSVRRLIGVAAGYDCSVLITGESGTGKEVVSKRIHAESARKNNPFVAINCAAIPENLIESELFGYQRGAFTSADQAKIGLFEAANGGTLFLDEINNSSLSLQAKLLAFWSMAHFTA